MKGKVMIASSVGPAGLGQSTGMESNVGGGEIGWRIPRVELARSTLERGRHQSCDRNNSDILYNPDDPI